MSEDLEEVPGATWGMVVESDWIYSKAKNIWYEVTQRVTTTDGRVKVMAKGVARYIVKAPGDPVRLKRGATGKAVDLITIIFSGATVPEAVGMTKAVGPTLDDLEREKDEA
jgi:hypothetical protein